MVNQKTSVEDKCDVLKNHQHVHGKNCGHKTVEHGDHVDYVHDGHFHRLHGKHVDECKGPEGVKL